MKIINVNPGLLPIPPNGWGAIEKIIWDYHNELIKLGIRSEIKYANDVKYDDSVVVHVHVANLANILHEAGVPYIFTIHDHHAYLYGKESPLFFENLKAIENSVFSLSPCKYLLPYFGSKKLRYFSHAVNTDVFYFNNRARHNPLKLLCVANNGYAYNQSLDRKGFKIAIQAAKKLNLPITIAGPRNNDNFFKTLDADLNGYSKLTKLYDLDEKWLVDLYKENDLFLHFSELEAGHPNLTLLEAMACGLPVVGTFEEKEYDGMVVCERDLDSAVKSIEYADKNYESLRKSAVENAIRNSYSNRVHGLIELYSEYRESIFANQLEFAYNSTTIVHTEAKNRIKISFDDGAKAEVLGNIQKKYKIKFVDKLTNSVVYQTEINNNMWATTSTKYYNRWLVEVFDITDGVETLVQSEEINLKDKPVKVVFDSESLGDTLAWIGSVDEFQKRHECKMYCVVFNKYLRELFEKNYSNITFLAIDVYADEYYAKYKIGCFDSDNYSPYIPKDPRILNLCSIANSVLGITDVEYKPKISVDRKKYANNKKYVCIAVQSTCQAKYWNNKNGWNNLVKYLKSQGYEVWCIDRFNSFGVKSNMNYIPEGCVDKTGDFSLEERMAQLAGAKFFVGLSSGLSWLAWAVDMPIIMISGFTKPYNEFYTPHRIINEKVCNGCWNDTNVKFDRGDWLWCPYKKNFECSTTISVEQVLAEVNKLI